MKFGNASEGESFLTRKEVTAPTNFPQAANMINIMLKGGIK
jgi:hypothetical protein